MSHEEEHNAIAGVRQVILRLVREHEEKGCGHSKPGQVCHMFRGNVIAYLAHSLKLGGVSKEWFETILKDYDRDCNPGCHRN